MAMPPPDIYFVCDNLDGPHKCTCNASVLIVPKGRDAPLEPYYMTDLA
jgi:hypothetical protein